MPTEIYEVVAQGARYWFLFLMALIVWRSYRWYRRDRRQWKKRMRLLPDAGYIGEMVVIEGGDELKKGMALPVPREGVLGFTRLCDLCVPVKGVYKRHCWFRFEPETGLVVEPFFGKKINIDGEERVGRHDPLAMAHGSRLYVGEAELRLRLFAGFESAARVNRPEAAFNSGEDEGQASPAAAPVMTQEQFAQWQQQAYQQQYMQQLAYQQWLTRQQWAAQAAQQAAVPAAGDVMPADQDDEPADHDEPDFDLSAVDFAPAASPQLEFETDHAFYPPTAADDEAWPYLPYPGDEEPQPERCDYAHDGDPGDLDEDMTDAAAPPKSAYVGHDEAAQAKKAFWDKYFGGGGAR